MSPEQLKSCVLRNRESRCGSIRGMRITIDSAGRLVIPVELRREAGIQPGIPLEIRVREGRVEVEPAPLTVKLERRAKGRLLLAVPQKTVPSLTADAVEGTRRKLRRERAG